ncbi:hypothetical protein CSA56_12100 [candidate division KSB3 bacterium]|uniref:Uncharacterized protein n=1 Tax=candidate division KSB3 bacterium TaxID=2044937 RepID=A0A2G6KES7_9BACT|nr:MAG: hypothetical protein CSA56_12100 [candidate division KSB3 bacterium]
MIYSTRKYVKNDLSVWKFPYVSEFLRLIPNALFFSLFGLDAEVNISGIGVFQDLISPCRRCFSDDWQEGMLY